MVDIITVSKLATESKASAITAYTNNFQLVDLAQAKHKLVKTLEKYTLGILINL